MLRTKTENLSTMRSALLLIFVCLLTNHSSAQVIIPNLNTSATATQTLKSTPPSYTSPLNYIRTWQPSKAISLADVETITNTSSVTEIQQQTQYTDGLGRPIQVVNKGITPNSKDIVAPILYDEYGRESYKYLPYPASTNDGNFKSNAFGEQQTFMQQQYSTEGELFFYSKTNFEASPLNKVDKVLSQGNSWVGSNRGVEMKYWINTASDDVKIWDVTESSIYKNDPYNLTVAVTDDHNDFQTVVYNWSSLPATAIAVTIKYRTPGGAWGGNTGSTTGPRTLTLPTGTYEYAIDVIYSGNTETIFANFSSIGTVTYQVEGTYPTGKLFKNVTVDENGKQIIEFKSKEGNVILKKVQLTAAADNGTGSGYSGWLCTYYIYDDFNNLRCVIQPRGVELINPAWTLTDATILNEQCFRYDYDSRNRLILKKVPGAAEVHMLYDKRDRLVFSQDGNMRSKNWWMTTLYDNLDRPVATGMTVGTKQQLQDYLNDPAYTFDKTTTTVQGSAGVKDLAINKRESGRTLYQASNSITFNSGFTTEPNSEFIAEIVITNPSSSTDIDINGNPFPSGVTFTALTLSYYDNYNFTQKVFDNTDNSKLSSSSSFPETLPAANSFQTKTIATGGKVWILEDPNDLTKGRWLETVLYYDDKGRTIQVVADNYKGGAERVTTRYDFAGKIISTYLVHNNPASSIGTIRIKTNMNYDHAGRVLDITKQLNDNGIDKIIVKNEYDELGQLKNKKLGVDPNNNSQPLETLTYDYNIRGWMKGINKDYVNNTSNTNYFGQTLSYDYGFTAQQYNGNIAGQKWRSKGDGEQRAYGYDYDAANRLLKADFTQNNGGWNTSAGIDFSMKMGDGSDPLSAYDANGNIKKMQQWGLKLNTSFQIDNLTYTYFNKTNKLQAVSDPIADNKLGDFTDKNTTATDYGYDVNGNLITDLNKGINGSTGLDQINGAAIVYNYLNLPAKIPVADKGIIEYLYDATGNKLEKKTVDNTVTPSKTTITSYINGFVYENNALQFFGQEEGRVRFELANPNNCPATTDRFVYDYFVKDHLGNVRMVLTEQHENKCYPAATLEDGRVATEKLFYEITDGRIVDKSSTAANSISSFEQKLYRTHGGNSSEKTGLGITLKVMTGDKISIKAESFYTLPSGGAGDPLTMTLSQLLGAFSVSNAVTSTKGAVTTTNVTDIGSNVTDLNTFINNNNTNPVNRAKAYLNWILFDDKLKYVSSGADPVQTDGGYKLHDAFINNPVSVSKNGYLYVFVSNESNLPVYFDNLQITHTPGPILEETHYYPFGLRMEGISAKASNIIVNKNLYNSKELQNKEFSEGSGLELYDYCARMQDPQLGRWLRSDPLSETSRKVSPYVYGENNPIKFIDPTGMAIEEVKGGIKYTGAEAQIAFNLLRQSYNPTPAPKNVWGTPDYYSFRDDDAKERNGESPDYYLSYGQKYASRFMRETYHKLSKDGQQWLLLTLVQLQLAIELKLKQDPTIELDNEKFSDFAFASHIPAYENSGVLKLGVMDKINIALTPDAKDAFSPRGIEQISKIAADQMKYYKDNKAFAAGQAFSFMYNSLEIAKNIIDYCAKNGTDPEQVWGLIKDWIIPN